MWAFLTLIFERLFNDLDRKVDTLNTNQEKHMKVSEQILADVAETKTNLVEVQGDLATVLTINGKQIEKITGLETQIADLKEQLGENAALDQIAASVAELKANSRAIADVYTPPAAEPAAV
jgi:chromosome segregation ATPase